MNFKEYKKSSNEVAREKKDKASKNPEQKLSKGAERLLKNFVKDYEGKSQEEVISEIVTLAQKNRDAGKLSDGDLDNFYNMLVPMLDKEQVKILDGVIAKLKS